MRKLLTLCLLVLSVSVSAQWQLSGAKVRYVTGIGIPTKDTAAGVLADSSQILIRPQDSSLYIKYKRTWVKVGGGTISGTTNYISKFTSSTAIGNSQIFDDGTNVGIGTTSPSNKLDVFTTNRTSLTALGSGINVNYNGSNIGEFATIGFSWASSIGNNSSQWGMGMVGTNYASGAAALNFFTNGNERMRVSSNGNVLIGTTTDNGTDKMQVNGSIYTSSNIKSVGGIIMGTAGAGQSLSTYLGGSNDAYPLANNAYVIPGVGWRYLGNGAASIISYESGDLIYYTNPTNSSGANATISTFNQRFKVSAAGNFGIGTYASPAGKLTVEGTTLINVNSDNGIDKLQVSGSIQGTGFNQNYVTKTGTYTASTSDYVIDCTSGTFTVNLFTATSNTGRILIIKNSGTGTITVDPSGAQTVDGASTYSLSAQYATVQIVCDGTNWKIISKF